MVARECWPSTSGRARAEVVVRDGGRARGHQTHRGARRILIAVPVLPLTQTLSYLLRRHRAASNLRPPNHTSGTAGSLKRPYRLLSTLVQVQFQCEVRGSSIRDGTLDIRGRSHVYNRCVILSHSTRHSSSSPGTSKHSVSFTTICTRKPRHIIMRSASLKAS